MQLSKTVASEDGRAGLLHMPQIEVAWSKGWGSRNQGIGHARLIQALRTCEYWHNRPGVAAVPIVSQTK
jgi:hypothetical protein